MPRKYYFYFLFLFFVLFLNTNFSFAKMKVGVVEFEERNPIGLKNASEIIPELLAEKLVEIGKYEVTERLLLAKVLEEQELTISGVVDTKIAPKVGEIYGLEGIITGSFMKIGNTISISARLIKTETGKVVTAGTIKMDDINDLQNKIEILAYLISGISRDKMMVKKDIKERAKSKYGIIFGSGYFTCSEYNNSTFQPAMIGLFYGGKNFHFIFSGILPFANIGLLETGIDINISYFLALGGRFNYLAAQGKELENKKYINFLEYTTALIGFTFIPTYNLDIGVYMGPMLNATYNIYDENNIFHQFKVKNFMHFPPPAFNISINWSFSKNFGIRSLVILLGGDGENVDNTSDWDKEWIDSMAITVGLTYKFSFTTSN